MWIADNDNAAKIYLGPLTTLALGQNTGLRPGEIRASDDQIANPLNGVLIKSKTLLHIESADAVTGNVRYVRTRSVDPNSLKEFLDKFPGVQITMNSTSRTEIEVENGSTREVRGEKVDVAEIAGRSSITKYTHDLITVTREP